MPPSIMNFSVFEFNVDALYGGFLQNSFVLCFLTKIRHECRPNGHRMVTVKPPLFMKLGGGVGGFDSQPGYTSKKG